MIHCLVDGSVGSGVPWFSTLVLEDANGDGLISAIWFNIESPSQASIWQVEWSTILVVSFYPKWWREVYCRLYVWDKGLSWMPCGYVGSLLSISLVEVVWR